MHVIIKLQIPFILNKLLINDIFTSLLIFFFVYLLNFQKLEYKLNN
jgi:hypothetical protein